MRNKAFEDYSPEHLGRLKHMLAGIYSAFGGISENLYLVGGLVPDLLVKNKLPYLKEYLGTLDIDLAIKFAVSQKPKYKDFYKILRSIGFEKQKTVDGTDVMNHSFIKHESGYKPIVMDLITDDNFDSEISEGTKDVASILVKRYGLERVFANKEIVFPIKNLKA